MKIACFADLHLTDNFNTVKLPVLRWAMAEVCRKKVDCIALLGDLTATGTMRQTKKILAELASCPMNLFSTPGNAEYRHDASGKAAEFFDLPPTEESGIFMMNTAFNTPTEADLIRLAALPENAGKVLFTHAPPHLWESRAQTLLQQAEAKRAVTFLLAGHSHIDSDGIMRGLDPDKAAGNPPGFEIISSTASGEWQREKITMPGIDPVGWQADERAKLHSLFGISVMYEPLKGLQDALALGIPHVELRFMPDFPPELPEAIALWRKSGGRTLSMHLTNLDSAASPYLAESVDKAIEYGCDRVTLHVPKVTAAKFPEEQEILLANFDEFVAKLLDHDILIGIENLHTTDGKRTLETRNFGCNIAECRQWITLLREKYQTDKIGFHCDIGHARNNAPLSAVENLSDYYCELGALVNGWHFHQVVQEVGGGFKNHRELTGFFTKLISLGGFLMEYRRHRFPDAPIFLEVTTPDGGVNSYRAITTLLKGEKL